jgi:hypothetical protein
MVYSELEEISNDAVVAYLKVIAKHAWSYRIDQTWWMFLYGYRTRHLWNTVQQKPQVNTSANLKKTSVCVHESGIIERVICRFFFEILFRLVHWDILFYNRVENLICDTFISFYTRHTIVIAAVGWELCLCENCFLKDHWSFPQTIYTWVAAEWCRQGKPGELRN